MYRKAKSMAKTWRTTEVKAEVKEERREPGPQLPDRLGFFGVSSIAAHDRSLRR